MMILDKNNPQHKKISPAEQMKLIWDELLERKSFYALKQNDWRV